jgi:Fe-S-cluster containining protein
MERSTDQGPLAFFQAQQAAFAHTLQAAREVAAGEPLIGNLLGQAFDSFDRNVEIQAQGQPELDCGRGCAACCTLRVTATAPEVLGVVRFLRAVHPALQQRGVDLIGQLRAAHARTVGLSEAERVALRQRCPFMAKGVCVIYQVRPLACRGHASHDRHACAEAAAGRSQEVPCSVAHMTVRSLLQNAMQSALRDAGLAWSSYELNAALLLAWDHPDALAAWRAGEDPLASARVSEVDPEEMAAVFDQLKLAAAAG